MATRTVVVADSDPGGYDAWYTSLSAAEAGEQGDLVTLTRTLIIECEALSGDDTTAVTFNGYTCSAAYNITVRAAPGHEHGGVQGAGYKLSASNPLTLWEEYAVVQDIEVESTETGVTYAIYVRYRNDQVLERCIFSTESTTNIGSETVYIFDDNVIVRNCLIFTGPAVGLKVDSGTGCSIENNTIVGTGATTPYGGIAATTVGLLVKNTVYFGPTTFKDYYVDGGGNSFSASCTNNASTDTSAEGSSPQTGISSTDFVASGSGDYTPASGGKLDGNGANLSADFTDDITGATRTQWDIGAFGVTGGGGATSPKGVFSHVFSGPFGGPM